MRWRLVASAVIVAVATVGHINVTLAGQIGPIGVEPLSDGQKANIDMGDSQKGPNTWSSGIDAPAAPAGQAMTPCVNPNGSMTTSVRRLLTPTGTDYVLPDPNTGLSASSASPSTQCGAWAVLVKDAPQHGSQWAVDQVASVEQHLAGGLIMVHPQPDQQFVNVPSQVYLEGAGINGQPTAYLRQTIELGGYNFAFVTKLVEVDWKWGDGTADQLTGPDAMGRDVYPPNGVSTVQHRYERIGEYQVQAVERWAVVATMTDPSGHLTTIPAATREFQRAVNASFRVLQIEGVPSR